LNDHPEPSSCLMRGIFLLKYVSRSFDSAQSIYFAHQQTNTHVHLALGALHALLTLVTSHYIYHTLGQPLVQALLSEATVRRLNGYLNSAQTELLLAVLKLWNILSDFASGTHKKTVFEEFHWGNKVPAMLLAGSVSSLTKQRLDSFQVSSYATKRADYPRRGSICKAGCVFPC
jgi:Ribosome 60S biogenesis N-terminal